MKKYPLGVLAIILLCSHDMFLKMDDYFLEPQTQAVIQLFNGTFERSENVIDRNRMTDVSLVSNGERTAVDSTQWFERDSITFLNVKTGNAGTYVAGVSTAPRDIAMEAEAFNNYLEHDGVVDMLAQRKENGTANQNAVEKYSKHVKTIFQVGDTTSDDWNVNLGYPIEFIPQENPYGIHKGHKLAVQLLVNGAPVKNQLVLLGNEPDKSYDAGEHTHDGTTHTHNNAKEHSNDVESKHSHGGTTHTHNAEESHSHSDKDHSEENNHSHAYEDSESHTHLTGNELRTDDDGIVQLDIISSGVWHLRTIYMTTTQEKGFTHESNWATLTFAVGDGHSDSHSHDNEDEHHHEEGGFPSYIFWIGSFVVLVLLFLFFNKKK